jgi:hypothetical protein
MQIVNDAIGEEEVQGAKDSYVNGTASSDKQYGTTTAGHTVTLKSGENGFIVASINGLEGEVIQLPYLTAGEGQEFKGWNATAGADTGVMTHEIDADATLYAIFGAKAQAQA